MDVRRQVIRTRRTVAWLLVGLLAGAFAYGVWPTPYREVRLARLVAGVFALREHRWSGRIERLTWQGWRPLTLHTGSPLPVSAGSTTGSALDRLIREHEARITP